MAFVSYSIRTQMLLTIPLNCKHESTFEITKLNHSIDFETIIVPDVDRLCSFKENVLMILTIVKILKIHYNHFWLEFLNKFAIIYSKICYSKNLYRNPICKKNQLTGCCMIQVFSKGIFERCDQWFMVL